MKIIIPGGTGQAGKILERGFRRRGHETVILSRSAGAGTTALGSRLVPWDGRTSGPWEREMEGADAVVNLAGRSVNCRATPANKREILDSRVDSTRAIARAVARAEHPPRVWLQASTATIYSHRFDAPNDDVSGVIGGGEPDAPEEWRFSIEVARAWEGALRAAGPLPRTRTVLLRSAMTMSADPGGVFATLLGLARAGLGGRHGNGRQFVSWIHEADFFRAVLHLIEHDSLSGPVNLASPHPATNADFMRGLRKAWGMPFGLPAARWMLEVGALVLGTETELILKSRRVIPRRLLDDGFEFLFPAGRQAARDLCAQWRAGRRPAA